MNKAYHLQMQVSNPASAFKRKIMFKILLPIEDDKEHRKEEYYAQTMILAIDFVQQKGYKRIFSVKENVINLIREDDDKMLMCFIFDVSNKLLTYHK